jgi:hypothetical protein
MLDAHPAQGHAAVVQVVMFGTMASVNYAGVALSFAGPPSLLSCMARVPGWLMRDVAPAASVTCQLHETTQPGPPPFTASERGWLHWEWQSGTAQVMTRSGRGRVWKVGGNYEAEAWLPPHPRAAVTMVGALASAVLHDLGGLLLHAASVRAESGVVAFIGPSGAGKSTACEHFGGAPLFSIDRLTVVPRKTGFTGSQPAMQGWFALPVLGGTPVNPVAPRATPDWVALSAILRVHQSREGVHVEQCPTSRALATLRESAFTGGTERVAELELLARLERLAADVPIAHLHFGLGSCLETAVGRWLSRRVARSIEVEDVGNRHERAQALGG